MASKRPRAKASEDTHNQAPALPLHNPEQKQSLDTPQKIVGDCGIDHRQKYTVLVLPLILPLPTAQCEQTLQGILMLNTVWNWGCSSCSDRVQQINLVGFQTSHAGRA